MAMAMAGAREALPYIPWEIWHFVLHVHVSRDALPACAKVSRAWREVARELLAADAAADARVAAVVAAWRPACALAWVEMNSTVRAAARAAAVAALAPSLHARVVRAEFPGPLRARRVVVPRAHGATTAAMVAAAVCARGAEEREKGGAERAVVVVVVVPDAQLAVDHAVWEIEQLQAGRAKADGAAAAPPLDVRVCVEGEAAVVGAPAPVLVITDTLRDPLAFRAAHARAYAGAAPPLLELVRMRPREGRGGSFF